jgi:transcriptional regulator with XRE-family HTH domain
MSRRKYSTLNWTEIGARVQSDRQRRKLSQKDLADLCHLKDKTSISKIESGKQSLSLQEAAIAAAAFGRSIEWILTGKDSGEVRLQVAETDVTYGKLSRTQKNIARLFEEILTTGNDKDLSALRKLLNVQIDIVKRRKINK